MESSFTLSAPAPTDLWRKPPAHNVTNAPTITQCIPLASFKSLRVTVSANWERQYDQGGLIIAAPDNTYWIKAGIEFFNGQPCVASVATESSSDWSLAPGLAPNGTATFEFAPVKGALWLYLIQDDGERIPLREVTWFLAKQPDVVASVGVYCCRPTAKDGDDSELVVQFTNFALECL